MNTVALNHINITAPYGLLEKVRDFYANVLGLTVGDRPDFMRKGFWLYSGNEPIVHLTACDATDARNNGKPELNFFDHIAFSCKGLVEAVSHLKQMNIAYEVIEIDSLGQTQVFVRDPAGVGVELNFVDESLG